MVPFCNGAASLDDFLRGADCDNTLKALAEACQVTLTVQTLDCDYTFNDVGVDTNNETETLYNKAAWRTKIRLIGKQDHFAVAWA